ncbi:MAG: AAA family ATPase [Clostridia bacterium]|nr:AAA family ATPase [Clostridia bacterium]
MKFGVLGKSLPHTYSPRIHNEFADYEYTVLERDEDGVKGIFDRKEDLDGFNVTIPYKKLAMQLCDEVSEEVAKVGAVNTVKLQENGVFKGYNTDVYGFMYMLRREGINVASKQCLILGTGGASAAVRYALKKMGARVNMCSRTGEINYENVYDILPNTQIIVNTTPVGMYPNVDDSPIDISRFTDLFAVADIIYNPSTTKLLFDARQRGLKTAGGLSMLVAQAYKASAIFNGRSADEENDELIEKVIADLESEMKNITLVGMPGSGKTTIARKIAQELNKELVDLDFEFKKEYKVTPSEVITKEGEKKFREMEHELCKRFLSGSGRVISTGGGIVTVPENLFFLKCNSKVIYLKRPLKSLLKQDVSGRPISKDQGIEELLNKRTPMYEEAADIIWDLPDFEDSEETETKLIEGLVR